MDFNFSFSKEKYPLPLKKDCLHKIAEDFSARVQVLVI